MAWHESSDHAASSSTRVFALRNRLRYLNYQGTPLYQWNGGSVEL
jgi:hypothetical protein